MKCCIRLMTWELLETFSKFSNLFSSDRLQCVKMKECPSDMLPSLFMFPNVSFYISIVCISIICGLCLNIAKFMPTPLSLFPQTIPTSKPTRS